jgi:hypothetical protein
MTPLIRGALEAAFAAVGVEADVGADGTIIDRYDGKPFTDRLTIAQALLHVDLIVGALVGHKVTFGREILEDLAHHSGFAGFQELHELKLDDLRHTVTPFTLFQAVDYTRRIIDAESFCLNQKVG